MKKVYCDYCKQEQDEKYYSVMVTYEKDAEDGSIDSYHTLDGQLCFDCFLKVFKSKNKA